MDYYNIFSFRECSKSNAIIGNRLTITSSGIIINSSITASSYNLDVVGSAGAHIQGALRVGFDHKFKWFVKYS
jgi:hypothetical protein